MASASYIALICGFFFSFHSIHIFVLIQKLAVQQNHHNRLQYNPRLEDRITATKFYCTRKTHCTGEMFMLCGEVLEDPEMSAFGRAILKNSLCVYHCDGCASASYLVPYKVHIFYPEGEPEKQHFPAGTVYGKRYDDWADDQDWSLCFAAVREV